MTDEPPAENPKRSRTIYILWGVALGLLLADGFLGWLALREFRMRANEEKALLSCAAYAMAQPMCRSPAGELPYMDYCHPYSQLYTRKDRDGQPMMLIDRAFAVARGKGGIPHHGYLFEDMETIAGKPINWVVDYALCGTPDLYGRPARRTFIVKTDGVVWGKDLGRSEFVKDFPADPEAEGWENVSD